VFIARRTTPAKPPLGTHGRLIGFLIEHYAGNFPLCHALEQVRVLSISHDEALVNYVKAVVNELRANFVRLEGDYSTNKINGKIQEAEKAKVHPAKRDLSSVDATGKLPT
jgi:threonyl-tRNA synthetase